MENMMLQVKRLLSYSVVYPDRHDNIEDLLKEIPSATAVEVVSHLLAQKATQLIGEHDFSIWAPWLMKTRDDVKNPIGHYATQTNLGEYALIDEYSLLLLISRLLACYNGRREELTEDDTSNLLLAYMICCDERLAMISKLPSNDMSAEDFVSTFMPAYMKTNDIDAPRDYRLLLIKCFMLLIEFPKHNEKFASYVKAFCEEKGLPSAKNYLDELFLTFLELTGVDKAACAIEIAEQNNAPLRFFDNLSVDTAKYKHDDDFLMIREKPIVKTGPRRYNVLFMRMFLDKAYTGLLFDMKDALVNKGLLNARNGYSNLRAYLGNEFSEKFFFYALMKRCFGQHYENITGGELEQALGDGMSDYYLRRGNRVFLFECKDAQVAAKVKLSGDYEVIKNAVFDKYVRNAKGHEKGVSQLARVIREKLPTLIEKMDGSVADRVLFVFPVVVYFDSFFDVEGSNYLLNKEFERQMACQPASENYEVKDVVMVNIEQLMRLENFFADDKLELATLINEYIDYKSQNELNEVFPFNKFLFQEARKVGYEMKKTRWFDEVYQTLVKMDKNN